MLKALSAQFLYIAVSVLILSQWAFLQPTNASDHIDGPITSAHPITDLTDLYVFPSPDAAGKLTLVLNTRFAAAPGNHFNQGVFYKFHIRPVQVSTNFVGFETGEENAVVCEFITPRRHSQHEMICTDSKLGFVTRGGFEQVTVGKYLTMFSGLRSDPFFFSGPWAQKVSGEGKIVPPDSSNSMIRLNVLSIVVQVDPSLLFPEFEGSTFAVAASSSTLRTSDSGEVTEKQLDWIGRPEITNVTMVPRGGVDLRDDYNSKLYPFSSDRAEKKKYHDYIFSNIGYYDAMDGKEDWNPLAKALWTDILLDDFLVVDLAQACSKKNNFLAIEKALLENKKLTSCGGRQLTDDIMDSLFNLYINANQGPRVGDGVDAPFKEPSDSFPYLIEPEEGVLAWAARNFAKAIAAFMN